MKKTYDYAVIYNGKFYPANTPIEVKEEKVETPKKPQKGGVKNDSRTV